jgi:hypothetical protein
MAPAPIDRLAFREELVLRFSVELAGVVTLVQLA